MLQLWITGMNYMCRDHNALRYDASPRASRLGFRPCAVVHKETCREAGIFFWLSWAKQKLKSLGCKGLREAIAVVPPYRGSDGMRQGRQETGCRHGGFNHCVGKLLSPRTKNRSIVTVRSGPSTGLPRGCGGYHRSSWSSAQRHTHDVIN